MRGGSRGVKNKNIKLINGRPLMYYTIKQAIKSKIFDHIVVSTDSKKLLKCAKSYGAHGWFIRPKKLSSDSSSKVAAIQHALIESEKYYDKKFKFIMDLDVTSPLRKVKDIINAYKVFIRKNTDILITGTTSKKNPYFNMVEFKNDQIQLVKNANYKRRQDTPKVFDMNASFYIWKRKYLLKTKKLISKKTVLYEMSDITAYDIDNILDLKINKSLINELKR